MTNRERIVNSLDFNIVPEKLPCIEWAPMWDKTVYRWKTEGLPEALQGDEIKEYFGLDSLIRIRLSPLKKSYFHDFHKVSNLDSYIKAKEHLYPEDNIHLIFDRLHEIKRKHQKGETATWLAIDGFFWFPRVLFGIEEHFYAFYDYPDVIHSINYDLSEFMIRTIDELCKIITPVFMAFNEDMAYNNGPMLSKVLFNQFLKPYYDRVIPVLKNHNVLPFIDCDGFVEDMIPWFIESGIEGILPLERQAGVDICRIRRNFPRFRMLGAFDKMVMNKGEDAMRNEFERLLPVMRSGGYIPSCDHQTPPGVSMDDYRIYVRLLKEYCTIATKKNQR